MQGCIIIQICEVRRYRLDQVYKKLGVWQANSSFRGRYGNDTNICTYLVQVVMQQMAFHKEKPKQLPMPPPKSLTKRRQERFTFIMLRFYLKIMKSVQIIFWLRPTLVITLLGSRVENDHRKQFLNPKFATLIRLSYLCNVITVAGPHNSLGF